MPRSPSKWSGKRAVGRGRRPVVVLAQESLEARLAPAGLTAVDDAYVALPDTPLSVGPTGRTSVVMWSDPGDWIGQGRSYAFDDTIGSIDFSASDRGVWLRYFENHASGSTWWDFNFVSPAQSPLRAGTYAGATRWPFQSPEQPGMDVSGDGRGSNQLTGSFVVQSIDTGELPSFHATFEQHSEGAAAALRGEVFYRAPSDTPGLLANDVGGSGAPLRAVLASSPTHGRLVFRDDGSFTYRADASFVGTDRFRYVVTDGVRTSDPATVSVVVSSRLRFLGTMPDVVAGGHPSIRVALQDEAGRTRTEDSTSVVTLEVASGPGGLAGTVTAKAVHGIATFDAASLQVAGDYVLAARCGTSRLETNAFRVVPAAPARIAIVEMPSYSRSGFPLVAPVTVGLYDSFGNLVTSSGKRQVSIAIASGPGILSGTKTAGVVHGNATFPGLVLATPGEYKLRLTTPGLPALISPSLTIWGAIRTTLRAEPSRALPDTPLTLRADVTFERPAVGKVGGGTVTFYADDTVLGTATVVGGRATLKVKGIPEGVTTIRATYSSEAWWIWTAWSEPAVLVRPSRRSGWISA